LTAKVDDINSLINHNWTQEEIKARIARRTALTKQFDPAERERVRRLLQDAEKKGETDKVEELREELDKLTTNRLAFKTSLGPDKSREATKVETEQDRLAERNKLNRAINAEAVRKAQLKEKMKVLEMEKAIKRGELVKEDPSRRLRTKAKFVHDINQSQDGKKNGSAAGSATSTPANGTPTVGPLKGGSSVLPSHLAKLQEEKNGVPSISKPLMDDDVIGALDLDIDIEI
jgi:RNA polymerase-associated protein RTF1